MTITDAAHTATRAAPGAGLRAGQLQGTRRAAWSWSGRGWLVTTLVAVLVALLVEGAYVLAEQNVAGRGVFIGQIWAPHDVAQYIAAMNDGGRGALLVHDRLTAEPHRPALIYTFYVALGRLTQAAGLDAMTGDRVAGVAGRVFVLLSVYAATALVSPVPWRRQLAFALTAFGGGLLTLLSVGQFLAGTAFPLTGRDLEEPEFGTFLLLLASPHLMFGLGLLLLAALAYVRAWGRRSAVWWRAIGAAAALTAALGLVNSYSLGTLCAVVGVHAVVMTVLLRRIVWRGLLAAAVVHLAAAPVLLYGILTFVIGTDPFWGVAYGLQNVTPTPDPLNVMIAFGLVLLFALTGLRAFARHLTPGRVLVLAWIATSVLLMYLPVGVQRRFAFGLQPMLAMVAAFGLPPAWRFLSHRRRLPWSLVRSLAILLLFQGLFGSAALLGAVAVTRANDAAQYTQTDERSDLAPLAVLQAGRWLADHTNADSIILAQPAAGNALVQVMPGRVYIGHWSATVAFEQKRQHLRWFFAEPLDDARRAFLADRDITFIVVAPNDRPHAWWTTAAAGDGTGGVRRVFEQDGAAVYQVEVP